MEYGIKIPFLVVKGHTRTFMEFIFSSTSVSDTVRFSLGLDKMQ